MASLGQTLFGQPERMQQVQRFSPQQQGLQQAALQRALGMLNTPRNLDFAPIAQQAESQFYNRTIPSLLERFTAMGGASQNSSALQQALGQAGAGLSENLAAMGSQYGLQQAGLENQLLSQLLGSGLQPGFDTLLRPGTQGFLSPILGGLGEGIGEGLGLGSLFKILQFLIPKKSEQQQQQTKNAPQL